MAPSHDWTRDTLPPGFELTPWQRFMRDLDWSLSPLGLMASWPLQLRQMVLLITQDPQPAAVYWSDRHIHIYNEAYVYLLGDKHPALQGKDPHIVLDDVWLMFDAILKESQQIGRAHVGDGQMLLYTRRGYLEETYYSWKFVPVLGDDGTVVASHATVSEVTREVLSTRRTSCIRGLRQIMAKAEDLKSFWSLLLEGLTSNDKDIPMAMVYSTDQKGSGVLVLEGRLGVPPNHPAAPTPIDLEHSPEGLAGAMRASLKAKEPLLLSTSDEYFGDHFFDGLEWRGFGAPSHQIMICPIRSMADDTVGFLVIGLNPRNPFDSDYRDFIRRITDSVDPAKVSSILLAEEMSRQEENARCAALDRELKYRQFADHAPLGVCRINTDSLVEYANDAWYTIMGQRRSDHQRNAWRKTIHEDDLAMMNVFMDDLMACKGAATVESRLKKPWAANPNNDEDVPPTWILASGYTEMFNDGSLKNVVCWVTDISAQKAAAKGLKEKMEEALELKRQQENFMDMISHEIRNPLSAMLHCSDEIIVALLDSLKALKKMASWDEKYPPSERHVILGPISLLGTAQDAARTIMYCIQHQRRVVDDVLTLSKLDADLLTVSPCPVQPVKLVREALKIFDSQLRTADICFDIQEDLSLTKFDWITLDPGRFLQVLMNLFTNAIKFTRTEPVRNITVTIGLSQGMPVNQDQGIKYLPPMERKIPRKNQVCATDNLYLSLAVKDTGRGITEEQMKALFQRFSQATPKTYAQYGGSGLGLFISRQITEMLGGAIGVHSTSGEGSTFAFYVATHPTMCPKKKASFDSLLPASIRVSLDAVLFDTSTSFLESGVQEASGSKMIKSTLEPSQDLKILVVEDNIVNQKILCKQLRKLDFAVDAANHGGEALEALKDTTIWSNGGTQKRFDVVLMDLEMPVMGGLEAVRIIRRLEEDGTIVGHIPVIAVTANARREHAEAAMKAGMDGVMKKPYLLKELLEAIASVYERCHSSSSIGDAPA